MDSAVDCAKKYSISYLISSAAAPGWLYVLGDNSLRNITADFTLPGVLFLFFFLFFISLFFGIPVFPVFGWVQTKDSVVDGVVGKLTRLKILEGTCYRIGHSSFNAS